MFGNWFSKWFGNWFNASTPPPDGQVGDRVLRLNAYITADKQLPAVLITEESLYHIITAINLERNFMDETLEIISEVNTIEDVFTKLQTELTLTTIIDGDF